MFKLSLMTRASAVSPHLSPNGDSPAQQGTYKLERGQVSVYICMYRGHISLYPSLCLPYLSHYVYNVGFCRTLVMKCLPVPFKKNWSKQFEKFLGIIKAHYHTTVSKTSYSKK